MAFESLFIKTGIVIAIILVIMHIVQEGFQFSLSQFFIGPGSFSRIALLCVVLANFKNIPLVWHARLFGGLFTHHQSPSRVQAPHSVFLPVVTQSHSPLAECDFNLHKSNATFFSDLDVTRAHLLSRLLHEGLAKLRKNDDGLVQTPDGKPAKGPVNICLGAAQCTFKREIKPYQPYEMWSRILTWDSKWLYIVTHFVAKGAVPPAEDARGTGLDAEKAGGSYRLERKSIINPKAIFASAISKQVIKIGRLSVDPEVVLTASGLPTQTLQRERERGLEYAKHFAALDGLVGEFYGADGGVLGVYSDLL